MIQGYLPSNAKADVQPGVSPPCLSLDLQDWKSVASAKSDSATFFTCHKMLFTKSSDLHLMDEEKELNFSPTKFTVTHSLVLPNLMDY